MKKFISLFLCILMLFSLTACKEKEIGADLANREDTNDNNMVSRPLNLYVIVGDGTGEKAKTTVLTNINVYLEESYSIQLEIHYLSASEYESTVMGALADGADESKKPDIILINSVEMFNTLYGANKLAPLTSFYNNKKYQKLNAIVEDKLLASSLVEDAIEGANGTITYEKNYYTVPNNHRIGEYKYIVIDKAEARDNLHYSSDKIAAMNDERDIADYKNKIGDDKVQLISGLYETKLYLEYGCNTLDELKAKIGQYYDDHKAEIGEDISKDEYVKEYSQVVTNNGESFVKAPIEKVNFVNVASYPTATKTEAFESAFAVIKSKDDVGNLTEEEAAVINEHYTKCVDIIYALNNDVQFRNMLQYGYVGTNYNFVKDEKHQNTNYITLKDNENVYYNMNLALTGNPYIAYYCEQQGWTALEHDNVLKQNAASYTLDEKITEESASIKNKLDKQVFDLTDGDADKLTLCDNGSKHGDVTVTWTTESEDVKIVADGGALYLVPATGDVQLINEVLTVEVDAVITATLTCTDSASGETLTKTVNITVKVIKSAEAPAA